MTGQYDALAWKNKNLPAEKRAKLLVNSMKQEEKFRFLARYVPSVPGFTEWNGGVDGNNRLQYPPVYYQQGSQGFVDEINIGSTTVWPSILALSQAWDTDLSEQYARALGKEFREKGAGLLFGPGLNMMRVGLNGRDYEYMSGEDPYLASELVVPYIKGIQSNNIVAAMKNLINDERETHKPDQDSIIDERTQFEIYFPPFEAAIKAGIGAAICSKNKVNGIHACQNYDLITRQLRSVLGFEGFVMSDWNAIQDRPLKYFDAGCDQEMNHVNHFNFANLRQDLTQE